MKIKMQIEGLNKSKTVELNQKNSTVSLTEIEANQLIYFLLSCKRIQDKNKDNENLIDILNASCLLYTVSLINVMKGTRERENVNSKRLYSYIASKYTNLSFSVIGKVINLHHTTIIHHKNYIEDRITGTYIDSELSKKVYQIEKKLGYEVIIMK